MYYIIQSYLHCIVEVFCISHGTNFTVNVPGQSAELLLATVVDIPVSMAGAEGGRACGMVEGAADAGDWVCGVLPEQPMQQHRSSLPKPNFRPRYVAQISKAMPIKTDDVIPTLNPWSSNIWKPLDLSWMTVLPWISLRYLASQPSKISPNITIPTDTTPVITLGLSMLLMYKCKPLLSFNYLLNIKYSQYF